MANQLLIKRSATPAKVPLTTDLALGEMAINTYDGKLYIKKDAGTPAVVEVAMTASTATAAQGAASDAQRVDVDLFGFLNQTETTIAFDHATSTFTLAPVGVSWSYYRSGIKHTITGAKTVVLPAANATTTIYFIYIDSTTGALEQSTTPWTLTDTKVPVATVARCTASNPTYLLAEERHSCRMPRRTHLYLHATRGTVYQSGGAVTQGPTVGSPTDKTCAVAPCSIYDEDILDTSTAITKGNGSTDAFYSVAYRNTSTNWVWDRFFVPFKYTGGGAIEWDNNGTMTAAGAGAGGNTRWVNYYMLCNNVAGQESVLWVPGRAAFTSAAAAYGESFSDFGITGFPSVEAVAIYQFTWATSGTGLGLCVLDRTPERVNSNILTSTAVSVGTHNSLAGLQGGAADDYQHLTTAQLTSVSTLAGLATGILKNTTGTGVPSIAFNTDLPVMSATESGAVPTPPNNTTTFLRGDGTFATPAGGGSASLTSLTAATAAATIANGNYPIAWNWAQTTASQVGFSVDETSASTGGSGSQVLMKIGTKSGSTANPFVVKTNGTVNSISVDRYGTPTLSGPPDTGGGSISVAVTGGAATGSTDEGGIVQITAGSSTNRSGGYVAITGGASTSTSYNGGNVIITSGGSTSTTSESGAVAIRTADSPRAGVISITGGRTEVYTGEGGGVVIKGGRPSAAVKGSPVVIAGGQGGSDGGDVSISGGQGSSSPGNGGAVTITSGASSSSNGGSGNVTIASGAATNTGASGVTGNVNLTVANPAGSAVAGIVTLQGGSSRATQSGNSGGIAILGGAAGAVASIVGGPVVITGGVGSTTTTGGVGGAVTITAGAGGLGAAGGAASLIAGAGGATAGSVGGAVNITAGAGTTGTGGDINLTTGASTTNGKINFVNCNVANGTVASVLTASRGPTGASTAVQGWLAIKVAGTARFIPFW